MRGRGVAAEETISLKYGAGGPAMRRLVSEVLARGLAKTEFEGVGLEAMDDGAALPVGDRWLVVTTDSHVVQPPFFPGGDIGRLAVAGTVNDLAVMGATEVLGLTCAIVLEEGFRRDDLERIQASIRDTCETAGATIVAGDTKVMGRGELDGVVLNTTGFALAERVVRDAGLEPGDRIVVTGTIGDHGLAIMSARHELDLEGELRSDVAPINGLLSGAIAAGDGRISAMKDPTRGGLSSALYEMADKSGVGIVIDEPGLPVSPQVRAAGELLGIDPLHGANEGKAVLGVHPEVAEAVVAALRGHPAGRAAAIVGTCVDDHVGSVVLDTGFGRRFLTEPEGEPMPRIC